MGLFRHPHLVRGVVHTADGNFAISRGVVSVPDEVGESRGWVRLEHDDQRDRPPANTARPVRGDATPLEL
jgi:hypothetical protein